MQDYFQKRALQIEEETFTSTLKFEKKLKKLYKDSEREIKAKIDAIIRKYGEENKLTFAQAKKFIKSEKLTVLNSLLKQIQDNLDSTYESQLKLFNEHLEAVYRDVYYKTGYTVQSGVKIASSMAVIDDKRIISVLKRKNYGKNYSDRIWGEHRTKLANEVRKEIMQSIATGKTNRDIAKGISEKYGVAYKNSIRLVRTESNFFLGEADTDSYIESEIDQYMFLATLDSRTSKICRELDGKVFDVKDAEPGVNKNPMHVFCRSNTVPHIENVTSYKKRVMRDKNGKSITGDFITYEEWNKKYGEGSE